MTSVAGVKFKDLWSWACPCCSVRLVRSSEKQLEREASDHFAAAHGTADHPELPFG